jgi:hypothetical protein
VPILLREKGPQATFIRLTIGSGRQTVLTTTKREICWGLFGLQVISGSIFAVSQMFGRDYLRYW